MRIEESVPGSGACCGAALLNIKFEEYVKSRLGDKAFDRLLRTKPKSWQTAMRNFEEYVKRNFDPDDMEEFNVSQRPPRHDQTRCDGFRPSSVNHKSEPLANPSGVLDPIPRRRRQRGCRP